jgi:two-component system phosphate regulon sensor histidine kinase PhoR
VAAERGVEVRVTGATDAVIVTGVRDELAQVVQNLVDNAVKYSDAKGGRAVDLEVRACVARWRSIRACGASAGKTRATCRSCLGAGASNAASFAVLRVTDAGPGIERQYLPRLSERFYRVDPGSGLRPGTGLGLAIVKHVVQRHRGELLVESEPGRGSAFGVVLPMANGPRLADGFPLKDASDFPQFPGQDGGAMKGLAA